ncbi:hypothetical protein DPSP01_008864 [Paraphaeosphaeria sporulosa]|uniref:Uncharacterized protein n=1 Tax=Paraphaeosphaeria sporulosa TaxID=1460663 RepID=A0A177CK62_9PLEO|nr:uncharacterized protein CC84DRAFT_1173499 [Paraphaeosphaeria sporulosa]OAG07905.1 hypothetical protein CC84DRAFT_1173499 [Paraphaeosphaeria sporulosa]
MIAAPHCIVPTRFCPLPQTPSSSLSLSIRRTSYLPLDKHRMAPILSGSPYHKRSCTRKHSSSTRTRQVRPTERRMTSSLERVARSRAPGYQHQNLAPTPNRFSILADLEPSPAPMKWLFDFAPPPSKPSKRRRRRTGKQKLKYTRKIREARKSDVSGEICDKVAALSLNDGGSTTPTTFTKPRDSVTNALDTVRHHWAPQFRPGKSLEPTTPQNAFLQPDRIFRERASPSPSHHGTSPSPSHHEEFKQKEPRFFSLPAFLASPPPAALQIPAGKPPRPVTTRNSPTERSLAEMSSTSAQEAVASAGRALATEGFNTAHGRLPLYRLEKDVQVGLPDIESLPPITQQTGMQRQMQEGSHTRALPSTPLSITFPHVAAPVLTAPLMPESLPTSSPYLPADCSPNYVSGELSQLLLKKSWLRADIYKSPHPYTYTYRDSHLLSLEAVAGPSSDPSVAPLEPRTTSRFDGFFRSVYPRDFLGMGHGNPCWCSNCPDSVPLGELPGEEVWTTPKELRKSLRRGSAPLGSPRRGNNQQAPIGTDRPRKKSPKPVPTPRSSPPLTLPDGYEEIVPGLARHVLAPFSDRIVPQNNIWTMVALGDGRDLFRGSQPSAPPPSQDGYSSTYLPSPPPPTDDDYSIFQPSTPRPISATFSQQGLASEPELLSSDYELASEPEMLSYPTPTYELSELAWTAGPSSSSAVSPAEGVHWDGSVAEIYLSPTLSPAPSLPSAPHSPQQAHGSAEAERDEETSNAEDV